MRIKLTAFHLAVVTTAAIGLGGATIAVAGMKPASAAATSPVAIAVGQEPLSFDPHTKADNGLNNVIWQVWESLTTIANGKVQPQLASALPGTINSTTWQIKLRRGIVFSDGAAFNADAVVYSLNRIAQPRFTGIPEALTLAPNGASKVDNYTVRIRTKTRDPLLPNKLASIKIIPVGQADHLATPVGTGPYMLQSYAAGQQAVLVANPRYRGTKPQASPLTIKFIPDSGTRIKALQAGEVDLVPGITPDQEPSVPKVIRSGVYTTSMQIRLNNLKPPLNDIRVRQAINYAIDKNAITTKLFPKGAAIPQQCQPGVPGDDGFSPKLKPYAYNLKKAQQLIEAAGAQGKTLTFVVPSGSYAFDRQVGQLVAQELTQAGLNIDLQLVDFATWLANMYKKEAGPELQFFGGADAYLSSTRIIDNNWLPEGGTTAYNDPKLFTLVRAADKMSAPRQRQAAFDTLLKYACDQSVYGWLYATKDVYGTKASISYVPSGPSNRPNFADIKIR